MRPPREEEPLVQVEDVLLALHRLLVGLGHEVRAQVALVEGQHEEAVGQPARKEGVQGEVRAGVAVEAGCEEGKISSCRGSQIVSESKKKWPSLESISF